MKFGERTRDFSPGQAGKEVPNLVMTVVMGRTVSDGGTVCNGGTVCDRGTVFDGEDCV